MAIGEVDRQILATATLPGGVPNKAAYELIAGRDVGDDIGRGPSLAQGSVGPTSSGKRIDRLQVPVARLGEPAWLSFHRDYLTVAEGFRAPRLLADSRGPRPVPPLMGSPYRYSWPPPCVLRSVSQVQLFVGDKEAWDGPSAIRVGRRIHPGLGGRRIHSEPARAGRARYRVRSTGGGRSDPHQRRARHRDRSTGPSLRQWADWHGHTTKHL